MLRRRQDILDAARALFNAKSYDSVTMDEIAEEADLSRATLYNHYDSNSVLNQCCFIGKRAYIFRSVYST